MTELNELLDFGIATWSVSIHLLHFADFFLCVRCGALSLAVFFLSSIAHTRSLSSVNLSDSIACLVSRVGVALALLSICPQLLVVLVDKPLNVALLDNVVRALYSGNNNERNVAQVLSPFLARHLVDFTLIT